MAPKHDLSLLFHPKKPAKKPATPVSTPKRKPVEQPKPKADDEDEEVLELPTEPFSEFRLLSSAMNGWKYDVMKFDSRKPVDISRWQQPIKLNRKDVRRDDRESSIVPVAVGQMLGSDGKPVIGADGKIVLVDAEGRPIRSDSGMGGKDKGKAVQPKKRFQKKTRQVFLVPEETRLLRKEERFPWVLEDSSPSKNEVWMGALEDVTKAETHAFFMPAANDVFKFVPAHRWYKFQKKLGHALPTDTATVDAMYNRSQKKDFVRFGVSEATRKLLKGETTAVPEGSLVHSVGPSHNPTGVRRLQAVDAGDRGLFDDDDVDQETKRRMKRDLGTEGDMDEQVYEEEFADDDDKMDMEDPDEEAKEIEERLKKEYRSANKQREEGVVSDEEGDDPVKSKQAKAMQKLIRNREGNDAYDSEDEENPYLSEEEEEEEEEAVLATATSAIQQQQQEIEARARTPKPATPGPRPAGQANGTTSPVNISHGGHSVVAKRATSPQVPKPRPSVVSRGNSPLGAASPPGSRATSPSADTLKTSVKRKAEDSPPGTPNGVMHPANGTPKPKKRKPPVVAPVSIAELETMLVEWLRQTPEAKTRDCIQHFTPYLQNDPVKKKEFAELVRKVAALRSGVLVLRTRTSPSAPSVPSPAS